MAKANGRRSICILLAFIFTLAIMTGLGPVSAAETIRFVAANHPFHDVIRPLIPEFEKETGIRVIVENYEENQLNQKLTVEFTSGLSTVDVFMTRPLQEGRLFFKNNWYESLNSYLDAQTPAVWNWDDFPESTKQAVTIDGQIYAVPIATEWHTLFYRKDLFAEANLQPPTTFDELVAAAEKLHNPDAGICGIVLRGQRGAAVTQFSSCLYGFGGDFIQDGKCMIDSPEAIEAFKFYGKLLHAYGPPGVTNMSWPQAQALFASGNAAMWADASVLIAGIIDPDKSVVADEVGVAVFPAGPAGRRPYMVVPWGISVGAQSQNKAAAWEFILWATNHVNSKKALLSGLTVARNSTWEDREVVSELYPGLGESSIESGPVGVPYDRPVMTAVTEARDAIGEVIVHAIETGGTGDIERMAREAARKVDRLLVQAGEGRE